MNVKSLAVPKVVYMPSSAYLMLTAKTGMTVPLVPTWVRRRLTEYLDDLFDFQPRFSYNLYEYGCRIYYQICMWFKTCPRGALR